MSEHTHSVVESDTSHLQSSSPDSKVDAWAIFILIALAVSTAVFWVSHQ